MSDYQYALTYWQHYQQEVSFSSNLASLVALGEGMSDAGECGDRTYWRALEGQWVELDVSAEVKAREDACDARYDEWRRGAAERPWQVIVHGPDGTSDEASRHTSEQDARSAAAALPAILRPEVKIASR